MKNIISFLALISFFPNVSFGYDVYIKFHPGDCYACQNTLYTFAQDNINKYYVLMDEDVKNDSTEIKRMYSALQSPVFRFIYNDKFTSSLGDEKISFVYIIDNKKIVYKAPLKNFDINSLLFRFHSENDSIALSTYPIQVGKFLVSTNYYILQDVINTTLYVYSKKGDKLMIITSDSLAKKAFQTFFGASANIDSLISLIRDDEKIKQYTRLSQIYGLDYLNDSLKISVILRYKTIFVPYDFIAQYTFYEGKFSNCKIIRNLWSDTFRKNVLDFFERRGSTDSTMFYYQAAFDKFKRDRPYAFYTDVGISLAIDSKHYLFGMQPHDSINYKYFALYEDNGKDLRYKYTLPLHKPVQHVEYNMNNNFQQVVGHYPYVMNIPFNTLYDLKHNTASIIPLKSGNYDLTDLYKAKFGVYIEDLVYKINELKILYRVDDEVRICLYNLTTMQIIKDDVLMVNNQPYLSKAFTRFDGFNMIVSTDKKCKCFKRYAIK